MESEHLEDKVPKKVRDLFDKFLVVGLATHNQTDPGSVTILYLDESARVSASLCLSAMKSRSPKSFDARFYDQNLSVGYYVVYGQPVDVLSMKIKRTKAFDEMYGKYMGMFNLNESGCSTFLNTLRDWVLDMSEYHLKNEG
jgi:hypothetical protein